MSRRLEACLWAALVLLSGCLQALQQPMQRVDSVVPADSWDWLTAIPSGVPRADTLMVVVKADALAGLGLGPRQEQIVRTSASTMPAAWRIAQVQGKRVQNYADLRSAFLAVEPKAQVNVVLERAEESADATPIAMTVDPAQLRLLEQEVSTQAPAVCIADEGNPWILLRDHGVRAKLMARVERGHGLMQVVVSLTLLSGPPRQLPRDVRASCHGVALRCLTAADTLDLLYGTKATGPSEPAVDLAGLDGAQFTAVSERSDYRIPTNLKRLQAARQPMPATPALAALPGVAYPGPALLGDARALAAFLLQPEIYHNNAPQKVGWLMFSGEALKQGGLVDLDFDLGNGVKRLQVSIPKL